MSIQLSVAESNWVQVLISKQSHLNFYCTPFQIEILYSTLFILVTIYFADQDITYVLSVYEIRFKI